MTIQLELYRVFITVAEQGSFTLAARSLGLTQSAVSQSVRQLESLLGTRLFVRTARGAMLSDAGQVLMGYVGGLLSSVNTAQEYFVQLHGLEVGSLRIGASDTLCRHVLLPYLTRFHETYPGVTVQVTNRTSGETVELLRRGGADIGFVNLPVEGLGDFDVHELMDLHDCFVCGNAYRDKFRGAVTLATLAQYPLLMLERQSASRRFMDEWLHRQGIALHPQIELGSLELLMDFAESGLGVAVVVREFAAYRLKKNLHEVKLDQAIPKRKVGMLLRRGVPQTAAARVLVDMLTEHQ